MLKRFRENQKIRSALLVLCGVLLVPALHIGIAWAQQEVMMTGKDSSGNTRAVRTDANGNIITSSASSTPSGAASGTHGACTHTTMNVGTTGTACPPTPRTDRASILIQLVQAGETLTVTADGSTAATSTVGVAVADGSAYTDNLAGTVSANCRCTAATCSVRVQECN